MKRWLVILILFGGLSAQADIDRSKGLYNQIRCPVCDGQSIEDSEATLAQDLRRIVYTMVEEGWSDNEIKGFLVQRYGEKILLRPQFYWENAALWGFPIVVLASLMGMLIGFRWRLSV